MLQYFTSAVTLHETCLDQIGIQWSSEQPHSLPQIMCKTSNKKWSCMRRWLHGNCRTRTPQDTSVQMEIWSRCCPSLARELCHKHKGLSLVVPSHRVDFRWVNTRGCLLFVWQCSNLKLPCTLPLKGLFLHSSHFILHNSATKRY